PFLLVLLAYPGGSTVPRNLPDLDILPLEDGGIQVDAEAGGFGDGEEAVRRGEGVGDEALVLLQVVAADALQDEEVGGGGGGGDGGGVLDRAAAVVRADGEVVGVRQGGDLPGLGEAAAPADVRHQEAGGAVLDQLAEAEARHQALGDAEGLVHQLRQAG